MLVREGNKILRRELQRKYEALRGLIGKVNATEKDNDKVIQSLKKDSLLGDIMKFAKNSETFTVIGYFVYKDKLYRVVIDDQGKDKLVVNLYEGDSIRSKKKIKGIRMFMGSITDAVKSIIKDLCDGDYGELESPDRHARKQKWRADLERDRERLREREREIERERENALKEWEAEREKERARERERERERNREYSRDMDFIGKYSSFRDPDYGHDYSYSRIDMDPYGTAWI